MNIDIDYQNDLNLPGTPDVEQLQQWVALAIEHRQDGANVCIRFVNADESQQLNFQFRQQNKPTNVLSFPEEWPEFIEQNTPYIGDLVVCVPLVEQEAKAQDKSLQAHYAHLIIHGVLHLLGYDHIDDDDANRMEALEIQLLAKLGYNNPYEETSHD